MTLIDTAPRLASSGEDEDDEITHLWCCDENISMCGLDISGDRIDQDAPDEQTCKLCVMVNETWGTCPVPGCTG